MNKIQIKNKQWRAEVDLQGGRIVNLSYGDRCILGSYSRIDGKQGNTHVCVPNFGSEGEETFGLPFHGPARNGKWRNVNMQNDIYKIECILSKTEKYKADILVSQLYEIQDNSFIHTVEVVHKNGEDVPVNIGVHNYWDSPSGWEGVRVNFEEITNKVKENGNIMLHKSNTIQFPNTSPIIWEVKGFSHAVAWSGFVGDHFDSKYVCIEPVRGIAEFFGSEKSILKPGQKIGVFQKIIVEK